MIYSQKEKKRRRRFHIGLILIVSAMLICIAVLVGAYFVIRAQVNAELGISCEAVINLLPYDIL